MLDRVNNFRVSFKSNDTQIGQRCTHCNCQQTITIYHDTYEVPERVGTQRNCVEPDSVTVGEHETGAYQKVEEDLTSDQNV